MMMVLVTGLTAASSINAGIRSQYEDKLAQTAAESGLAMARACIAQDPEGDINWLTSRPLKPNTNCNGVESQVCTSASTADACYLLKKSGVRTTFKVGAGNPITVQGKVQKTRASTGTVISEITSTIKYSIRPNGNIAY